MGGCRCTFRECTTNSANSPGMHFFHFPHKDMERCKRWAQYSGKPNFIHLCQAKLRNKVVCETHFRDECFMNYKKERLVQKAIPTLVRQSGGLVLDYEESETPEPKYLCPTRIEHLIPPHSRDEVRPPTELIMVQSLDDDDHSSLDSSETNLPPLKKIKLQPPRILNVAAPQNKKEGPEKSDNLDIVLSFDQAASFISELEFEPVKDDYATESVADSDVEEIEPQTADVVLKSAYLEMELKYEREISALKQQLADKDEQIADKQVKIDEKLAEIAAKDAEVAAQRVKVEFAHLNQVETITTSHKTEAAPPVAPPPTKAQFFNGIKKYLSPSMTSLVRMEMFGGSERNWKRDEKTVSVELLQLGNHVFDFVRDEWRCRLPPKREVQEWLNQANPDDDEEDL